MVRKPAFNRRGNADQKFSPASLLNDVAREAGFVQRAIELLVRDARFRLIDFQELKRHTPASIVASLRHSGRTAPSERLGQDPSIIPDMDLRALFRPQAGRGPTLDQGLPPRIGNAVGRDTF